MTGDGRGELIPPDSWIGRLIAWCKARPLLVFIGTLFMGLGVAGAQVRYYRTKAARGQRDADLSAAKARQAESAVRDAAARQAIGKADAESREAARRDKEAGEIVRGASDDLDAVERRWKSRPKWPTGCLLFIAAHAYAGDCPSAHDLSGLTDQLISMSARLPGLDGEAASDAAAAIAAYQRQTDGLCQQLIARADLIAALEAGRTERDRLIESLTTDRDMAWKAWQAEIAHRSVAPSLARFGFSLGAGLCASSSDDIRLCGAGVWGIRW